jgi:hypothetical protein
MKVLVNLTAAGAVPEFNRLPYFRMSYTIKGCPKTDIHISRQINGLTVSKKYQRTLDG